MKQNKFKFLMSLMMLLSALSVSAYDFMVDGIAYNINGNEASVTYTDSTNKFSHNYSGLTIAMIPSSITYGGTNYSVSAIGESAFSNCGTMTSVTIPNTIKSSAVGAFRDCNALTRVNISDFQAWCKINFKSGNSNPLCFAHHLYLNGNKITDLVIPESLTSINSCVFWGCSAKSVTIPSSINSIGWCAFMYCDDLEKVIISSIEAWCKIHFVSGGSNPLSSAHHLYLNETEITDLVIPNSITSISYGAFWSCSGLKSVTIPKSVTSISKGAFYRCTSLHRLQFDAVNCSSINDEAFEYCPSLTSLQFGDGVQNIPSGLPSFYLPSKALVLPNSVKSIKTRAFIGNCATVVIGDNIESIASGAFSDGISVAYVSSKTPPPCANGAFANPQTLYVPTGCRGKYLMSDGWCEFTDIVEGSYTCVTDLALDVENATIQPHETLQLNVTIQPADYSATTLDWWSTNEAVATVSETGLITAVAEGQTDIWCSIDNKTVVCHVTVFKKLVDSLQLNYTDLLLDWDNIVDLTATIYPENVDQSVTWTIPENDNLYARVVGNKLRVMAMRSGSVTVTATSVADPSVSADCVITIQIPDVNGDTSLNIADVTALIDYLLGGVPESINIGDADVDRDGNVNIADVTTFIDKLLGIN